MEHNSSTVNLEEGAKPKKMTRAEFMVAFDEVNATLQGQIELMRENQKEIRANNEELRKKSAETRKLIEAL